MTCGIELCGQLKGKKNWGLSKEPLRDQQSMKMKSSLKATHGTW